MKPTTLDVLAATGRLGISRQTLYAYASRGLVRATPDPDDPRRSRYDRRDIDALAERRALGRARRAVAASTIDWGEPVLSSSITAIADGRVWYRGHDATVLAEAASLEQVAALLWQAPSWPGTPAGPRGEPRGEPRGRPDGRPKGQQGRGVKAQGADAVARALSVLAAHAAPAAWLRALPALDRDGAEVLGLVCAAAAGVAPLPGVAAHEVFARGWDLDARRADLVRRALVLSADHELNVSTFAVRVVASTGASLSACVVAGLAAIGGPLHGGVSAQVSAMLAEPGMLARPRHAIAKRLARGERLPGFGHRIYPDGDPRAAALIAALFATPGAPARPWRAVIEAAEAAIGHRANIDAALAVLEAAEVPPGAALALFAAGRTAGWIAHALEQHSEGALIRPRASYAGPAPGQGPPLPG